MEEKDILDVLKIILGRVRNKKLIWRLEGSTNLRIQGVDVEVNDVDILTDKNNYKIFKEALKDFVVEEEYINSKKEQSLLCNINDFDVEILYYDVNKWNMFDKIKMIKWKGLDLPILPLEYAKKFYEMIGKGEKAKLIEEKLKHPNSQLPSRASG